MNTQPAPATPPADPPASAARGALWVSAALLAAVILLRVGGLSGGLTGDGVALADMTAESGSYTAMTTQSGSEELLYLIDDRAEQLHVYRVRQTNAVDLVAREDLRQMFTAARAAALGAARP